MSTSTLFGLLPTFFLIVAILVVQYVWEPDRPLNKLKDRWANPTNSTSKFIRIEDPSFDVDVHYRVTGGGGDNDEGDGNGSGSPILIELKQ